MLLSGKGIEQATGIRLSSGSIIYILSLHVLATLSD